MTASAIIMMILTLGLFWGAFPIWFIEPLRQITMTSN